jgi:hypothetical protein
MRRLASAAFIEPSFPCYKQGDGCGQLFALKAKPDKVPPGEGRLELLRNFD